MKRTIRAAGTALASLLLVAGAAFAEIAGVGVLADQVDQLGAAKRLRKLPGR